MKNSKAKESLGDEILRGLQEFTDALEKGEDLTKRFRTTIVGPGVRYRYKSTMVKETRGLIGATPTAFARLLGISRDALRAWEKGTTIPDGTALRFMEEIRHNPKYWIERLQEVAVAK